jgi:hypothetical protein
MPSTSDVCAEINEDNSGLTVDSFFEEYGLMDPELSAAWDEDHSLRAKRARTASVSLPCSAFEVTDILIGQPNAAMEGSQPQTGFG